ncbi:MAG: hypothetical protein U9Q83_01325, partial [Bacteroidota bacterium]|nr:hypothetical protein [Bacteroidota bacterium]
STFQNEELWLIILEFSEKYELNSEQKSKMNSHMMNNEKDLKKDDPKLFEILKQIKLVADYIAKHNIVINKSQKKIMDLQQQTLKAKDFRFKSEYDKLVKRYDDIIELENSKIKFYQKAQNELLNLKENHIVTQKLLDEKNELEGLENTLLEKSIIESYDSEMTIDDFIKYESSYLEAIKEYSETVSNSSNQNLFEDVIQDFNHKTEFL